MAPKPVLFAFTAVGATAVAVAAGITLFRSAPEDVFEPRSPRIETAPLCPWRQPAEDLGALFPEATRRQTEIRILSGSRPELARRLGRRPTAEENSIQVHRVYDDQRLLGTVLVRRVKGEYGAVEMVLGVAPDGRVQGVRLQRLREPEGIARALENSDWLAAFRGKTVGSPWVLGEDVPDVPVDARPDAQAIIEGLRSLLVLLDTGERSNLRLAHTGHSL